MRQPLVVTRGSTKRIALDVINSNGQPYVLSGDEKLIFGVKKDPLNQEYIKYTTVSDGHEVSADLIIILTKSDYDAALGKYTTCIKPSMTQELSFGEYYYDIGLYTGVDDYYPIVECSPFVVAKNITSRIDGNNAHAAGPDQQTELSGTVSISETTDTSAIADERQARTAADQALEAKITEETRARQAADTALSTSFNKAISDEESARIAAIAAEKSAREAAIANINTLISKQSGTVVVEITKSGEQYSIGTQTCQGILESIKSGFGVYATTIENGETHAWNLDSYDNTNKEVVFYRNYIEGSGASRKHCSAKYTITNNAITYSIVEGAIPEATSGATEGSEFVFTSGGAYTLKQELANNITTLANEISAARNITDSGSNTTLKQSIQEAVSTAKAYTDTSLENFETFTITITDTLPETGEPQTFYLVPKESGKGYDKWWYITTSEGSGTWDTFGASATVVVPALPEQGDPDIDYIVNMTNGCLYYKWINDAWKVVAGSIAVVASELPSVANGNTFTDYYIAEDSGNNQFLHYRFINGAYHMVGPTVYTKTQIDQKLTNLQNADTLMTSNITSLQSDISRIDGNITNLSQTIENMDTTGFQYFAEYGTAEIDGVPTENVYTLYQYKESDGGEENAEAVSRFVIAGGGGGGGGGGQQSSTVLTVTKITQSPLVLTPTDKAVLSFSFSSTDVDGETVDGTYVWKRDNAVIKSGDLVQGVNTFDMTDFVSIGTQTFTLTVTDAGGSMTTRSWKVSVVDVRLESTFNDRITYPAGAPVSFRYTPYGANVSKTVHFKIDGVEQPTFATTLSGTTMTYALPAQSHGAHLVEMWITAVINNVTIETDHIFKDVMWCDAASNVPIISCIYRSDYYGKVKAHQFDTVNITYTVHDPSTSMPHITKTVDMAVVSTETMDAATDTWAYRATNIGDRSLQIACGSTHVDIAVEVAALDIDVNPVTAGLKFDFDPTGLSNTATNRLWRHSANPAINLTVSDNFDWVNGGYQIDEDGNQYFCVKSGTTAQINYNLFEDDPRLQGMAFKTIFRTANVKNINTTFLSCMQYNTSGAAVESVVDELPSIENANANTIYILRVQDGNRVDKDGQPIMVEQRYRVVGGVYTPINTNGLEMKAHRAYIRSSGGTVTCSYSEDDIIEFDFNIHPVDTTDSSAEALIVAYEDGVPMQARIYTSTETLKQPSPRAPIVIGSPDCDVHIYRMKAYGNSLEDSDVLQNFIADARDSDTVIARYRRNQIYNENHMLTPESVANACPQLKVIKISAPHFTTSKKNFVKNTTVECIHKGGDSTLDNWKFENCYHAGQGTTSDNYGNSARNIDIICCADGVDQISTKIAASADAVDPNYKTILTLGDGTKFYNGTGKVSLSRTSVPNNWFNIKVNVASSENANNALMQQRYNAYLPYQSLANKLDSRVKNDMEFYNCVVFIKETDGDLASHVEFNDNEWHFYAIGNIGDSKKTDVTRANDVNDMKEFCIEISDNTLQNSTFQSGVDARGNYTTNDSLMVYPIAKSKWVPGNPKYDSLYGLKDTASGNTYTWDDSFEFRYDMGGLTRDGDTKNETPEQVAQRERNKQIWRDFYGWVVTATDSEFVNNLEGWFIKESALYWYLFTERYTMMDNRAKNTFWHFGKTGTYRPVPSPSATFLDMYCEKNGESYIPTTDQTLNPNKTYYWQYAFELWDYDNDTSLGINNSGQMTIPYGKEDTDLDEAGLPIFNGDKSTFWRRISKLMQSQLKSMYSQLENANCWSATNLINQYDEWQNMFPEELWRLDIERKYYRPTFGTVVDNSIVKKDLQFMSGEDTFMNGRKKYQRRQWERDQAIYMATKYMSPSAVGKNITFRTNPKQPFTISITPYSDMYISVEFGNTNPVSQRAIAGQVYSFSSGALASGSSTQVKIYQGSNISGLNNLSQCYIDDNNFSEATKLQTLIIGSDADGYSNPSLKSLNLGNNNLLETIDVRNCPNLTGTLNLANCSNLESLYAEGTALKGVVFAENGKISLAHLPSTVNTLYLKNLRYLTDDGLQMQYTSLNSLTEENSAVDEQAIVAAAANTLQTVRLVGINWDLYSTDILNKLLAMDNTYLSGTIKIVGTYRLTEQPLYAAAWPDLIIDYSEGTQISQHVVKYVNDDAEHTLLYTMNVDYGAPTPDPVALGYIDAPTKAPSAQYTFTYDGWQAPTYVTADTTVTAKYATTVNKYTVKWYLTQNDLANSLPCFTLTNVNYGDDVSYAGVYPVNTTEEHLGVYNVFKGWDKSTGYIRGNTNVVALWQRDVMPVAGTQLKDMNEAQIYAVTKQKAVSDYFEIKDYIDVKIGHDFYFTDVESHELISTPTFYDGTMATDFDYNLFDPNVSFTLAIDCQFGEIVNNSTLLSCFDGNTQQGFRIKCSSGPQVQWGDKNISYGYQHCRDMVVLRHRAGENRMYIYASNASGTQSTYSAGLIAFTSDCTVLPTTSSKITIGAARYPNGNYSQYGKGMVYWCKVWMDDLGDTNAKMLASWPREVMRMEYYGANRYPITNGSGAMTNASFIANSVLGDRAYNMNATATTTGGYRDTMMRQFLNDRIYGAVPYIWKSLIKQVQLTGTVGDMSSDTNTSDNYIHIPAYAELTSSTSAYRLCEGDLIPWMISRRARTKFRRFFVPEDAQYFFTTTEPSSISTNNVKIGDIWNYDSSADNGYKYMCVSTRDADRFGLTRFATTVNEDMCWISATSWFTRSVYFVGYNTDTRYGDWWGYVNRDGYNGNNWGTGALDIVPCFSI